MKGCFKAGGTVEVEALVEVEAVAEVEATQEVKGREEVEGMTVRLLAERDNLLVLLKEEQAARLVSVHSHSRGLYKLSCFKQLLWDEQWKVRSGCLEKFALGNSRGSSDFPDWRSPEGKSDDPRVLSRANFLDNHSGLSIVCQSFGLIQ